MTAAPAPPARSQRDMLGVLPAMALVGVVSLWPLCLLAHAALADVLPVRLLGVDVAPPTRVADFGAVLALGGRSLAWAVSFAALEAACGLVLALVLPRRHGLAWLVLALCAWPALLPGDAVALVQTELVPRLLAPWLDDASVRHHAAAAIVDVWRFAPLVALVLYVVPPAPASVVHAAAIDGLSAWGRLRLLHLPRLRPALAAVVALRVVGLLGSLAWLALVGRMPGAAGGPAQESLALIAGILLCGGLVWRVLRGPAVEVEP